MINSLRYAYKEYLLSLSLHKLQAYGRSIGVDKPTTQSKGEIIVSIIAILLKEVEPVPLSKRGAPVKNDYVEPTIPEEIEKIRLSFMGGAPILEQKAEPTYDYKARLEEIKKNPFVLTVRDPGMEEPEGVKKIYKGQLETLGGVSMLLPLDCLDSAHKIIMPVELIQKFELQEGDVVTCYADKRAQHLVATTVLTVNELVCDTYHRKKFEESAVCFPHKRLHFYDGKKFTSTAEKYLEWLIPLGKGERGLIVAPPKTGKTSMFLELAKAARGLNGGLQVFTLLIDQSPENVSLYRKQAPIDHMVYTTYEDEPERQVFVADFILKRAKRYAECGNDVLLLVDSFNALANAFNDTKASSGGKVLVGSLESKTVQYLKRYFGTARCFEKGGSVTIVGAISSMTGNPADDLLLSQLSAVSTLEIALSGELAKRRIYPAVDLSKTRGKNTDGLLSEAEERLENQVRSNYLPAFGAERLTETLNAVNSMEELEQNIAEQLQ